MGGQKLSDEDAILQGLVSVKLKEEDPVTKGKNIVVLSPDNGDHYLSGDLHE